MIQPSLLCLALGGLGVFIGASPGQVLAQEDAPWTEVSLRHRAIPEFDFVLGQETWRDLGSGLELFGTDFPAEFLGAMRFEIDSNGDGEPDRDVKGETGFVDLKGKDANGDVFHYGVRFKSTGERKMSWAASGAMVGKVGGLLFSVVDANANGAYDDYGVDGLVIGTARGAGYLSRVVNINGRLYDLEIAKDGSAVKTRPFSGETGTLKLGRLKDVKAEVTTAIFTQGRDVAFQLAGETRGVTVPAGEYRFASAFLERGPETARVRTGRMDAVRVSAGSEVEVRWGGPLTGEVPAPVVNGEKATVSAAVKVFGEAGEEYYDFQPKGKVPSYELTDANTGKRLKKGKFPAG